jgi:hypothetical protein
MKRLLTILLAVLLALTALSSPVATAAAPAVPSGIVLTVGVTGAYGRGTIGIKWNPVSGASAYSTRLVPSDGSQGPSPISTTGNTTTEVLYNDLSGGKSYIVQVRAVNAALEASDWSSSSLTAIPRTAPQVPAAPTAVAGIASATVSWTAIPVSDNGGFDISSYIIKELNSGRTMTAAATSTSLTFTNLSNGATAEFTVSAVNAALPEGTVSPKSVAITLPDVPGVMAAPVLETTTTESSLRATWSAPVVTNLSEVISYTVTLVKDGVDAAVQTITEIANRFATFANLTIGTFTARVSAKNGVGSSTDSPLSNSVSITATPTAAPLPSASPSVSVTATPTASSASEPPPFMGGGGGGGFFGGGGGGFVPAVEETVTASASPSPTPSPTPSLIEPSPSPKPSVTPSPSPTAIVPTSTPTPSPSKAAITTKTSTFAVAPAGKTVGPVKSSTLSASTSSVAVKANTNFQPVLPTVKKGEKVTMVIKDAKGKSYTVAALTVAKAGSLKLPAVKFSQKGSYTITIKVGTKTKVVKINSTK